ncbi:4'-phosphopantetheinyl transferase family protein [Nonomuraea sp. 10N515B]|uniref:4'-phosphopantetheinyl transferase family protein n=1 Tax=Nonomuraea sp. 10N515B TaxID=3457422 RepID=UPI003FCC61CF
MIDEILPSWVASAEEFGDPPHAVLFPEEDALISGSAERRQREFRTSRHCAHRALRLLGTEPQPILRGDHGAPTWPPGVTGSITHCAGYRAAAVARGALAIGIDAEPDLPVLDGFLGRITTPAELAALERSGVPGTGRLLFCAKEAIYKAWYPLTGYRLGFLDATVIFTQSPPPQTANPTTPPPHAAPSPSLPDVAALTVPAPAPPRVFAPPESSAHSGELAVSGTFDAEIAVHGAGWPTHLRGRWLVSRGLILTSIAIRDPAA